MNNLEVIQLFILQNTLHSYNIEGDAPLKVHPLNIFTNKIYYLLYIICNSWMNICSFYS